MVEAKFKKGDIVDFFGKTCEVEGVFDGSYFYTIDSNYFLYTVRNCANNEVYKEVPEPSLKFLNETTPQLTCTCGAKFVHWASEHHSSWCNVAKFGAYNDNN